MITDTIQAWMLHKTWSGETSARVSLLTAEQGLVKAVCKGARKMPKQGILQPFLPLWVVLKTYSQSVYIQTIESAAPAVQLEGKVLFAGLYINEILCHLLRPGLEQKALMNAYWTVISGLAKANTQPEIEVLLRRFEWQLLKMHGYVFSLTTEAQTGLPIVETKQYDLIPGIGLVSVNKGLSGFHILSIAQDNLQDLETLKIAKYLMRNAIDYMLGGVAIQARNLYNSASF